MLFIQANLDKYTVKQMCSALKFSRSTYYAVMGGDNNDHFRRNTNGKRINRVILMQYLVKGKLQVGNHYMES